MSLRRKIFYSFTIAVIAILMVLPVTGWLARLQLLPYPSTKDLSLLRQWGDVSISASVVPRSVRVARRYPNDFEIQLANAMSASESDRVIPHLEYLGTRYPHNPVLIATLLRQMNIGQVLIRRYEDTQSLYAPAERENHGTFQPCKPERIAAYIALAEEGETLEPGNAFFPMAAAVGYFAARQDDNALAAWKRASKKSEWNDHIAEEVTAKWKLQQGMNAGREVGSLPRMSTMAAVLMPHYAQIHTAARLATVEAVGAELRGEKETGFTLRQATRKNGELVAKQGQFRITEVVGGSIAKTAAGRPGGVEAEKEKDSDTDAGKRQQKEKQERYVAYLRSIGHADEAADFAALMAKQETIRAIWQDGNERTAFGFGMQTFRLIGGWLVNALLLTSVLFALVFAAIFKLVYRFSPRLQRGEVLQASAKWGVLAGLLLPLIAVATIGGLVGEMTQGTIALVGAGVLLTMIVSAIMLRFSAAQLTHGVFVLLATMSALAGLVLAGAVIYQLFSGVVQTLAIVQGCMSSSEAAPAINPMPLWTLSWLVLLVPFAMLCLFGLFSRILKVPLAAGVTRGMRAVAVPLAAVLMLGWGASLLYTAKQERQAIAEMQRMIAIGETQTIAETLHRSYPK